MMGKAVCKGESAPAVNPCEVAVPREYVEHGRAGGDDAGDEK